MAVDSVTRANINIVFLCTLGLGLSIYCYHVETTKERDENFQAMCDISEHMSCSKVFTSEYGRGLGGIISKGSFLYLPNCLFGIGFYTLTIILALWNTKFTTFLIIASAILSNFQSVYFAYILFAILKDFCIVCVSIYVINAFLLYASVYKHKKICSKKDKNA